VNKKGKTVHCKKKQNYDVYIGRPSALGNPFVIDTDGNRDEVIQKYRQWLLTGNNFGNKLATEDKRRTVLSMLHELHGKVLGCYCAPEACHGDVLLELAANVLYRCTRCEAIYSAPVAACDCDVGVTQTFQVGFSSFIDVTFDV
jgi:hypothetical protein